MCFLLNKVDNTSEITFCTNWQLNSNCIGLKAITHSFDYVKEIRTDNVHFVHICNTWNVITVSLSPYGFRLRLNALFCTKYTYCPIQYTQGTFNFNSEVNVSWGINDIDAVTFPRSSRSSGRNRDSALLFLLHPVHCSSTLVNFTDFVRTACIEKNPLCGSCFTSINMRHDPDITCIF
ncbi:hypothetical protein D3C78_831430 [compost metagenome]